MKFPIFLQKGDWIGVTAPSDGNRKEMDFARLELACKNLLDAGYPTYLTPNVKKSDRGRSSIAPVRKSEMMELIQDDRIKSIVLAKGGDFLMEVLSLLDFDEIKNYPKWIQGFSDSTSLLFVLTTGFDIATMYSNHFNDFAISPWHLSQQYNFELLKGNRICQKSFDYYEDDFHDKKNPADGYEKDCPVRWKSFSNKAVVAEGRMIGGCMDVLLNLIGTRFDYVKRFVETYCEDGILWYLESFSLDAENITRGLWQMKEAGWFKYVRGFVFGRPCMFRSFLGYTYEEAVLSVLEEYNVPVIFDADIGHKGPQFTIVNGALATVTCQDGRGTYQIQSWD